MSTSSIGSGRDEEDVIQPLTTGNYRPTANHGNSFDEAAEELDSEDEMFHQYYIDALEDQMGDDFAGTRQLSMSYSRAAESTRLEKRLSRESASSEAFQDMLENSDRRPSVTPVPMRRRSTIASTLREWRWADAGFTKYRHKIVVMFLQNYIFLALGFAGAICIYWGAYYNKEIYFHRIRYLAAIDDVGTSSIPAIVGESAATFANLTALAPLGSWDIKYHDELAALASANNHTVEQEVRSLLHRQKYWAVVYVRENATIDLVTSLLDNGTTSATEPAVRLIYETGRDYLAMFFYVSKLLEEFADAYLNVIPLYYSGLLQALPSNLMMALLETNPSLLTTTPILVYDDQLPVPHSVAVAPLQLGMVYLVVFTFFQFLNTIRLHMYMSTKLVGIKYIIYRLLIPHMSYFFISLAYVCLNTAFGIPFDNKFGYSGWLVQWAFAYLFMCSLGSLNECMVLLCMKIFPPLIGVWILLLVVVNFAPTMGSIILSNAVYRYGYGVPMRNAYELINMTLFNSYNDHVGRNIGVLIAWIVLTNALLPFILIYASKSGAPKEEKPAEKTVKPVE